MSAASAVTGDRGRPDGLERPSSAMTADPYSIPALVERLTVPLGIGALAASLVFGAALLLGSSPLAAAVVALSVLVLPVAVADPFVALAVLVAVEVTQVGQVFAEFGVPSPLILTQALGLVALGVAVRRRQLRLAWSPVLLGILVLLATRALSAPGGLLPSVALATVAEEVRDTITLVLVLLLLLATRQVVALVAVIVLSLAAMALGTVVQEFLLDSRTDLGGFFKVLRNLDVGATTFRQSGPVGDSNFWGRVLLIALPFAAALAASARRRALQLLWCGCLVVLLAGIYLTQSRGTFLSAGLAVMVFFLLAGWHYARWLALTPLAVAFLLVLPATGERLATLGDLAQTDQGGGDLSLLLRAASQEAGLNMLAERPVLGVGAGSYTPLSTQFTSGLPFATAEEITSPLAPHNALLEFAAEGGVVGLLGFLTFLGATALCAGRAWWSTTRRGPPGRASPERLLAAAACAALIAWSLASVVLHVRQFRTLLVLAAVIAFLDLTRERSPHPAGASGLRAAGGPPAPSRGALVGLVGLGVVLLSLVTSTDAFRTTTWQATSSAVVVTQEAPGTSLEAYQYDLLARGTVVPTLAAVASSAGVLSEATGQAAVDGLRLTSTSDLRAARVTLSVEGTSAAQVEQVAARLSPVAVAQVDDLGTPFALSPLVPQTPVAQARSTLRLLPAVALAAGWLLLACALLWWHLERRYRWSRAAT